ncbi:hypothetical protein BD94_1519 [Elizabethkingia anophelis NUHP1]|uniref:Uncharacterized protein n=2 Tax=Elizabethkingia anophelis TaxID=1117645 RepID=A0A455ZGA8_9FLAO|nr:hypothetical protein BD94_1519 [Elizabethkingia anophelis NUHP1]DAC75889.1 TPA_exp: hypothetical protein [Elizabethkingia anophelis]DAC75979.1 TPA_exp: hypothetical protein [Elizabethkingia anophelis]DAC76526.1 TPA_exp: hypothetical protein [Elizabethkingia anophelis]
MLMELILKKNNGKRLVVPVSTSVKNVQKIAAKKRKIKKTVVVQENAT